MKKITYKLFPILICLLLIFPIMKENFSSFIMILLSINLIVYKISARDFKFVKPKVLLLTIPFWIIFFSSLFSNNYEISFLHVNHALFFLLIPVVFSLIPPEFFSQSKIDLYFFILKNICLLIAVIYVGSFLINVPLWRFNFQEGYVFREYIYSYFTLFVIHPAYYTTILILVFAHSLEMVIKKKKYWQLIYVVCFLGITFLLLTKLNIVIMILVLIFMLLFRTSLNLKQKIIITSLSLTFITLLIAYTPGIKNRFLETYNSFNSKPQGLAYDSTNIRKAIFDCSVSIADGNLPFGVGFEHLQERLNECYKANYDSSFYLNHEYMTHNYYFYILLSSGLIGLFFYLIYLANIIKISYNSKSFLLRLLVLSVLIMCFIEDYFYRHFGLLYFNLILMLYIRFIDTTEHKSIEA